MAEGELVAARRGGEGIRVAMRSVLAGLLLVGLVLGRAIPGAAHIRTPGQEFGLAIGAAASNLLYVPAKLIVAGSGLVLGSLTGVMTGGDLGSAYAVWVPTASGTFLLTPDHLDGTKEVLFFGSDYADRPSTVAGDADANAVYNALYK